jgi:hypothetical protein
MIRQSGTCSNPNNTWPYLNPRTATCSKPNNRSVVNKGKDHKTLVITGIEMVRIGEGTTIRELKNELRWNDIAYHLSSGIGR